MFLSSLILYCFFFFFQAEVGIRDRTVTGVQTCALPISRAALSFSSRSAMSAWRYTADWQRVIVFARRVESMIEAWLSWSEITMSRSPSRVGQRPSFAFQQLT